MPLDLPIAGAGSRALAAFLDYLIVLVVVVLWIAGCLFAAAWSKTMEWWVVVILILGIFLIEYGYFAGVEVARGGETFGKWVLGLRVVTRLGGRPGVPAYLIRNAVRSVDLLIGVPMMALDPLARRLGDRLAETLVVHRQGPGSEVAVRRVPKDWGPAEVALLENFLRRTPDMEPPRSERLARQLLELIERDDPDLLAGVGHRDDPVSALRRVVQWEGS